MPGWEWGQPYFLSCDSLPADVEALGIVAEVNALDSLRNCIVVIEVRDAATDSLLLWHGLSPYSGKFPKGRNIVSTAINFNEDLTPQGKTVKTYLWNQGLDPLVLHKVSYYFTHKSPRKALPWPIPPRKTATTATTSNLSSATPAPTEDTSAAGWIQKQDAIISTASVFFRRIR